jgi:hypothetical protein
MTLRCPACKHIFRAAGAVAGGRGESHGDGQAPLGQEGQFLHTDPSDTSLSKADEAMLREMGAGSGLLELTRETFEVSVAGRGAEAARPGRSAASAEALPEVSPTVRDHPDRQFQIVGTALTLANRLVSAYKGELQRTRWSARLGWATVAVLVVLSATALWWGTNRAGLVELERLKVASLSQGLPAAAGGGQGARTADESEPARQALSENRALVRILAADLEAANARLASLTAELERSKAALQPSTRPTGTAPAGS